MDLPQFDTIEELCTLSQNMKNNYLICLVSKTDRESIQKVDLLIKAGAEVNHTVKWFSGYSSLMSAASADAVSNMALLIRAGARLDYVTHNLDTVFSVAIRQYAFDAAGLLFDLMTEEQLKKEIELNQLRLDTFQQYAPDIVPFLEDFNKKNKKKAISKWVKDFLLPKDNQDRKNVFLICPLELRSLIYFNYCEIEKKELLEKHFIKKIPKPIIFSEMKSQKRELLSEENLSEDFCQLTLGAPPPPLAPEPVKRKKIKIRIGCIIS